MASFLSSLGVGGGTVSSSSSISGACMEGVFIGVKTASGLMGRMSGWEKVASGLMARTDSSG